MDPRGRAENTSILGISPANYGVNRSEFRASASASGIPSVFRNRGVPRRLEDRAIRGPDRRNYPRTKGTGRWSLAEKRISRYLGVLSACRWDRQKLWPSRCLGRPRMSVDACPRLPPPPFAAGETKYRGTPVEEKGFGCCSLDRDERSAWMRITERNRWDRCLFSPEIGVGWTREDSVEKFVMIRG